MNIYVEDYDEELYIEEYETDWGLRYRGESGEPTQINFKEEGWVRYYDLIREWKKLVDKLRKSEEIVVRRKVDE